MYGQTMKYGSLLRQVLNILASTEICVLTIDYFLYETLLNLTVISSL